MKKKIIKSFRKKKKLVIKKSKFFLRHPLLVPTATFVGLFVFGIVGFVAIGGSTQGASDARIVNVYTDGEQRTVTTRARTVGDLLERLEIVLLPEDIVEPGRDALLLEDDTQVNVYRARPVEVIDGERTKTVLTAQRAPRLVAAEAGISLVAEDEVQFTRVESNVLESAVSEQLLIDRSVEVQLNLYGAIKIVRTTADNIKELLQDEGITLAEGESVSPAIDDLIQAGQLISVNRPGVKTEIVTESLPYSSETRDDAGLEAGKSRIEQNGIAGVRAVVYEIVEENGVEIGRREIQQVVLSQPVTEIRLRGTKIVAPSFNPSVTVSGDKSSLMAAAGIAESNFGYVDYIISKESGWKPGAANSYSGAYGLCQALPASKMASVGADYLTNPITQLRWCSGYAEGRYGSWAGAYSAWQVQGWW
jgi:uncharacterized protein YabE (DUF348 family)